MFTYLPAKKSEAHAPAVPNAAQKGREANGPKYGAVEGGYRRRPSQQASRTPAFVDHPVLSRISVAERSALTSWAPGTAASK